MTTVEMAVKDSWVEAERHLRIIPRNIELLTGGLRARTLARERLVSAGEYAMSQLLEAFLAGGDPALQAQVQRVMVDLGRQAIALDERRAGRCQKEDRKRPFVERRKERSAVGASQQ